MCAGHDLNQGMFSSRTVKHISPRGTITSGIRTSHVLPRQICITGLIPSAAAKVQIASSRAQVTAVEFVEHNLGVRTRGPIPTFHQESALLSSGQFICANYRLAQSIITE